MHALRRPTPALLAALALSAAVVPLASCGGGDDAPERITVAAALYPLQEAAAAIGGDRVSVTDLTPVGGQPHDLVPGPPATKALAGAKVVLTLGTDFQPAISKAVAKLPESTIRVDLLETQELLPAPRAVAGTSVVSGGVAAAPDVAPDAHAWVDPDRLRRMTENIKDALIKADPDGRAGYEKRGDAYANTLDTLHTDIRSALAACSGETILVTHPAFAYFAQRYGLKQAFANGLGLAAEPDPKVLAAVKRFADANDVKTLFFNAPVPPQLAATIKAKTGLATDTLNPVEGLTQTQLDDGDDYESLMRENLKHVQSGLGCSAAP